MKRQAEVERDLGAWLLRRLVSLIHYRFSAGLKRPLEAGTAQLMPSLAEIQRKSTASLTTVGVFFGLDVAIFALLFTEARAELESARGAGPWVQLAFNVFLVVILAYVAVRRRDCLVWVVLGALAVLIGLPFLLSVLLNSRSLPFWIYAEGPVFLHALKLSGFVLVIASSLFLLCSLELFDHASQWGTERRDETLHFHLANMARSCYVLGVALALIGFSMLLCRVDPWVGRIVTFVSLVVIAGVTKVEIKLSHLRVVEGQTKVAVREMLGEPDKSANGGWTYSGMKVTFFGGWVLKLKG